MKLRPEILQQHTVLGFFHGINPRVIMGKDAWDIERQKVYASTNYHCACCGSHKRDAKRYKWLEAHEIWKVDYESGVCEITEIVPLCHYCHSFVHFGLLTELYNNKTKPEEEVKEIIEHGFKILSDNKLDGSKGRLRLASELNCNTFGVKKEIVNPRDEDCCKVEMEDFYLLFQGKKYIYKGFESRSKYKGCKDVFFIEPKLNYYKKNDYPI